ncbi:uncharacterized protein LOC126707493 [Quercus robur]|uniref:uncharacterized protein LOC126707493 n=1 Tax=Quercus robur TaxID=38942 RepID=UPI002161C6BE|nr:uncharacterized protein LOC126707493 [Quercus robur]
MLLYELIFLFFSHSNVNCYLLFVSHLSNIWKAQFSGSRCTPYNGPQFKTIQGSWVFEAFGQVELVQLPVDETRHCKGYGFVQFARLEDARNALSLNQQLEIAGRLIKFLPFNLSMH